MLLVVDATLQCYVPTRRAQIFPDVPTHQPGVLNLSCNVYDKKLLKKVSCWRTLLSRGGHIKSSCSWYCNWFLVTEEYNYVILCHHLSSPGRYHKDSLCVIQRCLKQQFARKELLGAGIETATQPPRQRCSHLFRLNESNALVYQS